MRPEPPLRALLLLTVLGLGVRLAFLALEPPTRLVADERTWVNWGTASPEGIASPEVRFHPFRSAMVFHPPLYPYAIAVVHTLFGSLTALKVMQAVFGALLVPAVGLAGHVAFGPFVARAAALAAAVYPELVWYSVHFWSEPLFLAVLWWAFAVALLADGKESTRLAVGAGVLWGLAALARETALYFVPVLALWMAWRRPGGLRRGVLLCVAGAAVVVPWTYRNWRVFDAFVPVSTMGGLNLWQGNGRMTRDEVYARYEAVQGQIEQYRHARRMGMEAIWRRQPGWIVEKVTEQMPHFWEVDSMATLHVQRGAYGEVSPGAARAAAAAIVLPYLVTLAGLVAAVAFVTPDRRVVVFLLFGGYYLSLHVITYGFSRFRMPLLPIFFMLGAAALQAWRERRPSVPTTRLALAGGLALLLAIWLAPSVRRNLAHPVYGFVPPGTAPPVDDARP